MSRISIPFSTCDISALARSLRDQLSNCDHTPGHVELLNMLARSTGHRNFQSLRAQAAADDLLHQAQRGPEPVDYVLVKRLAAYFDAQGRLASWPAKSSLQEVCLWVFWSKLPPRQALTESQLSAQIRADHLFGDHALLRRELCDHGLVTRTPDGREYRRVERQPTPEAKALIRHLTARRAVEPTHAGSAPVRRAQ
jgi:hypothetical protein